MLNAAVDGHQLRRMKVCPVYRVLCIPPETVVERDIVLRKKLLLKIQALKPQPLPTGNFHKARHRRIKDEAVNTLPKEKGLAFLSIYLHLALFTQAYSNIPLAKL